jgi:hypothetical protein
MILRRNRKKTIRRRRHPNNKIEFLEAIENLIEDLQTDPLFLDSVDKDEDKEEEGIDNPPPSPNVTPLRRTHVKPRRLFKSNTL